MPHEEDLTQAAFVSYLLESEVAIDVAHGVVDHIHDPGSLYGRDHAVGFSEVHAEGLLHDHVLAGERYIRPLEQFEDSGRGAGNEAGIVFLEKLAGIDGMESVDVFFRRDPTEGLHIVDLRGQGSLDENAVHLRVGIESIDAGKDLGGWSGFRKPSNR